MFFHQINFNICHRIYILYLLQIGIMMKEEIKTEHWHQVSVDNKIQCRAIYLPRYLYICRHLISDTAELNYQCSIADQEFDSHNNPVKLLLKGPIKENTNGSLRVTFGDKVQTFIRLYSINVKKQLDNASLRLMIRLPNFHCYFQSKNDTWKLEVDDIMLNSGDAAEIEHKFDKSAES